MTVHHFPAEDIAAKLELGRRLEIEGHSVKSLCRQLEVSELTYLRWYKKYSGLNAAAISRLRDVEEENTRLRRGLHALTEVLAELADVAGRPPTPRPWLTAVPARSSVREQ